MKLYTAVSSVVFVAFAQAASAAIIFDNFNVDQGHFGYDPNFSSTSVGDDAACVATRITSDSLDPFGIGSQQLTLVHDVSATALRIRHVSGGPPYDSANAGTPVGNTGFSFTTGAGVDGFIGFYLKTTATGWQTSINLDGPGGTTAEMDGSPSVAIIADGQWHLYEFDLDALSGWGAVPGIGGGHAGVVANGVHTIDSIYFRDLDGTPGPTADIFLDFVAKTDAGSVAALIPEPSALALTLFGAAALTGRLRRRP
jgi:hypothetical protein